ncbi:uracil-DNA glycosylase [Candidatus Dojkabacteria bacterium]|nr:uracil-DNA glycosylase [Candidatus Dojkabacteria bacterium]
MTLEELNESCKKCDKCRLRKGATQVVPGAGSEHAEIMFIGEGPGETEDKQGLPFVGAAGRFLNELLKSINLNREDVYIANMVKCRPPGNRDPQEDEIQACKGWLNQQIKVIQPKIFVPLGRFAMYKFLKGTSISKEHGKIYSRSGKVYFVMYHPAVALYNGAMRPILLEDIKKLRLFLDGKLDAQSLNDTVSKIISEKETLKKEQNKNQGNKDSSQFKMTI